MSKSKEDLYKNAIEADDKFEMEVKLQFGKTASRWQHPKSDWCIDLQIAFLNKVKADDAYLGRDQIK